ncbi:MAG: lipocalin-like domain-containing protein [Bdellovibrionota bacterium]
MNSRQLLRISMCFFVTLTFLATNAAAQTSPSFRDATGDIALEYPRDFGSHPEFATEWWYFTGHLRSADRRTFGFELVFFRVGVDPQRHSSSNWAMPSVYLAHFAVTDDKDAKFHFWERRSRGSFADAGAEQNKLQVWNGPWRASLEGEALSLQASADDLALALTLRQTKPITLHGDRGLSKKGAEPGAASYYASLTRLEGTGTLQLGAEMIPITSASAWYDQEFTSSKSARTSIGWDWFAIQLEAGQELMVYQLRNERGERSPFSSGTFIASDGHSTHLTSEQISLTPLTFWTSPTTGIRYPAKWKIAVPSLAIDGEVEPTVSDQELVTSTSTGVTYWEGRTRFQGTVQGQSRGGDAYMELVGYGAEQKNGH